MRLCAVSVDLDEAEHYFEIHGLGRGACTSTPVYDQAIERFRDFAASERLPLTLFAVGADVASEPQRAARLRELVKLGHEVASHTQSHRYDFSRLEPAEQERELSQAERCLSTAVGVPVRGFRAPGYVMNDGVYELLAKLGIGYSSSVFPCPAYYAAKAAALLWQRLHGRRSASILDSPQVLLAPRRPYRVGRPYFRRGSGVWELPIQVSPWLGLPFIGTSLTLLGAGWARWLARGLLGEPFINLELHGIDLLDAGDDADLSKLAKFQPDLRRAWREKALVLNAALDVLRRGGYQFVRIDQAVAELERSGNSNQR